MKDFKVESEEAEYVFVTKKDLRQVYLLRQANAPEQFFCRQDVITCCITKRLITAYGKLITCLLAELN